MLRCSKRREPAWQLWPDAAKMPDTTPLIAWSRSASSKTMFGDLPPSSSVTVLSPARGELIDLAPRGIAAGEADMRDRGMRDERRAGLGPESRDDVDDTVRKSRLGKERREFEHRRRRELRRLDDRRASGGERRGELPARERERRVPRRDDGDHAFRLVLRVGEHAPLVGRDHRALHLVGEAGVILEVVAHVADLGACLRQDLAVVALLDRGQPVDVGDDEIAEPPQAGGRAASRSSAAIRPGSARAPPPPTAAAASRSFPRPISAQTLPEYGFSVGRYSLETGGTMAPSM